MGENPETKDEQKFSLENTFASIGNREIALHALKMFFTLGEGEYLDPLKKSIDEKDMEKIFNISHKLSGVAARLKIKWILDPVQRIVQASRNKRKIDYNKYYLEIEKRFKELKENCTL